MKKAYVKPVFMAEEFQAANSYASDVCNLSIYSPFEIKVGMQVTDKFVIEDNGDIAHDDKWFYNSTNGTNYTNWEYATKEDGQATLFVDLACDFYWHPDTGVEGKVYVWDSVELSGRDWEHKYNAGTDKWNFMKFFTGNQGSEETIEFAGQYTPQST